MSLNRAGGRTEGGNKGGMRTDPRARTILPFRNYCKQNNGACFGIRREIGKTEHLERAWNCARVPRRASSEYVHLVGREYLHCRKDKSKPCSCRRRLHLYYSHYFRKDSFFFFSQEFLYRLTLCTSWPLPESCLEETAFWR